MKISNNGDNKNNNNKKTIRIGGKEFKVPHSYILPKLDPVGYQRLIESTGKEGVYKIKSIRLHKEK